MLAKGKAPKVLIAAARQEPVAHIGEGSAPQGAVTRPFTGQSLTTRQVESLHLFNPDSALKGRVSTEEF
jgi:hypothetical protein